MLNEELRNIEGIKGNFYISEIEYIAPATLRQKGKPASKSSRLLVEFLLAIFKLLLSNLEWPGALLYI